MKSHCGESVGFHLEPLCGFGSDFVCAKFLGLSYNSTFLSFPPSSVMIVLAFLSCFLSSSLRTKQLPSFQLKQTDSVVFLKCSFNS